VHSFLLFSLSFGISGFRKSYFVTFLLLKCIYAQCLNGQVLYEYMCFPQSSQDFILLAILRILCGWVLADHHLSQAMKLGISASVVEQWQLHLLPSPSHWCKSVPRFLKSYLVSLYLFKISVIVNRWFVVIISTLLLCKTRLLCSATLKGP
jgi:hypothetical protein